MEQLKRAILSPDSPIYLNTNYKSIQRYLNDKGLPTVPKKAILSFLEKQKFADIKYKNEGLQKISETSKPFALRGRFFSLLQADIMVLSNKRHYKSANKFVLCVICSLSRYIFLESCYSLRFEHQEKAWINILKRIKMVYPKSVVSTVISDAGSELKNNSLKLFFKNKGIKQNIVQTRPFRLSRGASQIESSIRRIRKTLESVMAVTQKTDTFKMVLEKVEAILNKQWLSSIGMSATNALEHRPDYMLLVSDSLKWKRRKFWRSEVLTQSKKIIPLYSLVQIKKFQEKQFKSSTKESYGFLSNYYLITKVNKHAILYSYTLASIFTLGELDGTYTRSELRVAPLNYIQACQKEETRVAKIVHRDAIFLYYKIPSCSRVFVANKTLNS